MNETYFYICQACESDLESACKLTMNTSPGIPTKCPFDIGLESKWEQVTKKEYENK